MIQASCKAHNELSYLFLQEARLKVYDQGWPEPYIYI